MSTITSNDVPTQGSQPTQDDAMQQAIAQAAEAQTSEQQEKEESGGKGKEKRESKYVVAEVKQDEEAGVDVLEVLGSFPSKAGQKGARLAALEANPELKKAVLNGETVTLVALANYNPVPVSLQARDPRIVA